MKRAIAGMVLCLAVSASSGCCGLGCGSCGDPWQGWGCGDRYYGDWWAGHCDKCDSCGNYTGAAMDMPYGHPVESEIHQSAPTEPTPPSVPASETNARRKTRARTTGALITKPYGKQVGQPQRVKRTSASRG